MRLRVRPWQLIAGLAVVCALAVAAAMFFRRERAQTPAQMATFMPRGEGTVFYVDFETLRQSGLMEKLMGTAVEEEGDYQRFVKDTGFDYKRDLDAVLSRIDRSAQLFLVRGRFDWKTLIRYAETHDGRCRNGLCQVPSDRPDRVISYRALGSNLMALAFSRDPGAAMRIAARQEELGYEVPSQPAWVSIPASDLRRSEQLPPGTRLFVTAVESAERVALTAGPLENRFEVGMNVLCRSPEDAAILRTQLESITALLSKMISREKEKANPNDLSGVLTSGRFERVDRRVLGRWPVERSFLEALGGS